LAIDSLAWANPAPLAARIKPAREVTMSGCMEKIWRYALKVFCMGLLALLVAGPLPAEEKTPKKEPAPKSAQPVKKAPCNGNIKTMAPARMKLRGMEGIESESAVPGMKKTTRKIGGQEIRAKEGEEGKK